MFLATTLNFHYKSIANLYPRRFLVAILTVCSETMHTHLIFLEAKHLPIEDIGSEECQFPMTAITCHHSLRCINCQYIYISLIDRGF